MRSAEDDVKVWTCFADPMKAIEGVPDGLAVCRDAENAHA